MTEMSSRHKLVRDPETFDRLELLLERYPRTSSIENELIGDFLKNAPPLEVGLMSSNTVAWANAEQFKVDHRQLFAISPLVRVTWLGLVVAVILGVILVWDAGLK